MSHKANDIFNESALEAITGGQPWLFAADMEGLRLQKALDADFTNSQIEAKEVPTRAKLTVSDANRIAYAGEIGRLILGR